MIFPLKKTILILGSFVVLLAFGIQGYAYFKPQAQSTLKIKLADAIPAKLKGWSVTEVPLGNTESLDTRSRAILNFDDYVFRSYRRGGREFSVYVAYWGPGKMPVRLVNAHTPDRCWTQVGFKCLDMKFNQPTEYVGGPLQPMEWRVFEINGSRLYVHFWHIVGGERHMYRDGFNDLPPVTVIFDDLYKFGLNLKREQFFVRITSDRPLDEFKDEPAYQEILGDLAKLCLKPVGK
ncbi:MAG: exosortase-associated EpsI family protein [Verrucomicrobiota bacterium]|nr:exosortase-associated EpsI family protein [Verrucomicrobiota bacterium]